MKICSNIACNTPANCFPPTLSRLHCKVDPEQSILQSCRFVATSRPGREKTQALSMGRHAHPRDKLLDTDPNSITTLTIMSEGRIKTGISRAHWCTKDARFEPTKAIRDKSERADQAKDKREEEICWLDRLFEGGMVLPEAADGKNRALTVLLTGPAGTGKSTLALELCHRLALSEQPELRLTKTGRRVTGLNSLYISAETNGRWPMQKATQLNWARREHIRLLNPDDPPKKNDADHYVWIDTTKKFVDYLIGKPRSLFGGISEAIVRDTLKRVMVTSITDDLIKTVRQDLEAKVAARNHLTTTEIIRDFNLDVLVVDSLNSIGTSQGKSGVMEQFVSLIDGTGLKMIIAILESTDPTLEQWLYVFDTVIRLDMINVGKKDAEGYLMRTLEIKKARYQSHVWGVHQLKFAKATKAFSDDDASKSPSKANIGKTTNPTLPSLREARRAHPYCAEGGIFIFPSIPYHLSLYKRLSPEWTDKRLSSGIDDLDQDLRGEPDEQGGFPYQRCTGFVGMRGGHKSHLGYLFVLNHILGRENNKALVVSLRDDENMARGTMAKILTELPKGKPSAQASPGIGHAQKAAEKKLVDLELKDQLELQFFPPGHIAPEEFYHRILISVLRLKQNGGDVVLLFNSLDQLASRFPLCAKEEIFVPGLIETLTANQVTSVFIGVDEEGQPTQQYGLLSMADALISFNRVRIGRNDYLGHLEEAIVARKLRLAVESAQERSDISPANTDARAQAAKLVSKLKSESDPFENLYPRPVVLDIVRFAGGQAAKIGGMLELKQLGDARNLQVWGKEYGLCYVPFSKKHRRRAPSE